MNLTISVNLRKTLGVTMSQIELKSCTASAKQSCAGLAQIPTGDEFQLIMLQEIGEEKVECWTLCCKVFVWVVVVRCSCVHERNETILFIITLGIMILV